MSCLSVVDAAVFWLVISSYQSYPYKFLFASWPQPLGFAYPLSVGCRTRPQLVTCPGVEPGSTVSDLNHNLWVPRPVG